MATYRKVVYSVLKTLEERFDDAKLTPSHVVFLIDMVASRIQGQHLRKDLNNAFLTIFEDVPVVAGSLGKKFVLPKDIYALKNDAGISFVAYQPTGDDCDNQLIPFNRTTVAGAHRLYGDKYEKPEPDNPYFARENENVHLFGIECVNVDKLIIGLYTVAKFHDECDLDAEIQIAPEHIELIERGVLEIAMFGSIVIGDRTNNGGDLTALRNRPKPKTQQQQDVSQ